MKYEELRYVEDPISVYASVDTDSIEWWEPVSENELRRSYEQAQEEGLEDGESFAEYVQGLIEAGIIREANEERRDEMAYITRESMSLFTESFLDEAEYTLDRLLGCGVEYEDSTVQALLTILRDSGRNSVADEFTGMWFE